MTNREHHTGSLSRWIIGLLVLVAVIGGGWLVWNTRAHQARQADVAARGAEVMPFDLDQTMHQFVPQPDGGVQTVVARDPANTAQIALIRDHLQTEATRFAAGNFSSPVAIHGHTMPGIAELEAGADRIAITYTDLPDGGQIRYITTDPALVDAIHRWFEAQVSDHGDHATDH